MAKSPRTIYSSTQTKIIEYYSIDDICNTYTDTDWCSNKETISDIEKSISLGAAFVIIPSDYENRYLLTKTESDAKIVDNKSEEGYLTKTFYPPGVDDKAEEIVLLLVKPGTFFPIALRKYVHNIIDADVLEQFPKVVGINEKNGRVSSIVEFKLSNEDYEEMFDISEDDIYLIQKFTGYGSDYYDMEFYDDWHVADNFSDGFWHYEKYNEDNQEKIKTIYMLLNPSWAEEDYRFDREIFARLYRDFKKLFPDILRTIMDDTQYQMNTQVVDSLRDVIRRELQEFFIENGFNLDANENTLKSNIAELIMWSARLNNDTYTPKQLLYAIFNKINSTSKIGGWYEDYWSFINPEFFDVDRFNIDVGGELDKIIESLEEEYDIAGWKEISDKVYKNFPQGYSKPFPNYKDLQLVVDEIDPKTLNVKFKVQKGLQQRNFEMPYDKFNEFIYNKKLFDFESLLGF